MVVKVPCHFYFISLHILIDRGIGSGTTSHEAFVLRRRAGGGGKSCPYLPTTHLSERHHYTLLSDFVTSGTPSSGELFCKEYSIPELLQ